MKSDPIIQKLLKVIDSRVNDFGASMSGLDEKLYSDIEVLLKDMDLTTDGRIVNNAKNLSLIGKAKAKIEQVIRSDKFNKNISELKNSIADITEVQHEYFITIHDDYEPHEKLKELQTQTISDTVDALKGSDMKRAIVNKAQDILRTNITKGKGYTGLLSEMRDYLLTNDGPMARYSKQIATATLNTFASTYNKLVATDLGLKWHAYVGVIIDTSRAFCIACCNKEFIHESEFAKVVKGDFKEFIEIGGKINHKTGLPMGMMEGTNQFNFDIRAGGRANGCNHLIMPVSSAIVPKYLRAKFGD